MTHGSLFSGIGGFDLAAEWMDWKNVFHCEINPFGRKILNHYWPEAESLIDITKTDFKKYANKIDILTGGFPCQPYSTAGKRRGKEDDRHLWPEMLRAIREIQPSWVVGENVRGLVNWNGGMVFDEVQADLENEGFEIIPFLLPACGVNAPHQRYRIWIIAYSPNNRRKREGQKTKDENREQGSHKGGQLERRSKRLCLPGATTNTNRRRQSKQGRTKGQVSSEEKRNWQDYRVVDDGEWPTQAPICSGNDGISNQLDGITFPKWRQKSIKGYGNAIVPQVVYQIFKAIEAYESESPKNRRANK